MICDKCGAPAKVRPDWQELNVLSYSYGYDTPNARLLGRAAEMVKAYPQLVAALREMLKAQGVGAHGNNAAVEEWLLGWHDTLVAREENPSLLNIQRAIADNAGRLLASLGEES